MFHLHRRHKPSPPATPPDPPVPVHPNFVAFGEQPGPQFHPLGIIHIKHLETPKAQQIWYHTGLGPPRPWPEPQHKQEDKA